MSVYVGIDVHRKRSQVAVVTEDGGMQLNRNVVNGAGPVLKLIGGLPAGTPVAFEAAFGWGWLVQLLEGRRASSGQIPLGRRPRDAGPVVHQAPAVTYQVLRCPVCPVSRQGVVGLGGRG